MSNIRSIAAAAHTTALGLWLGCVVMTGVAAAVTFPTIKKLNPSTPEFANYTGEQWLIVAGHVVARIFYINDIVQFACALIVIVSTLVLFTTGREQFRTRSGAFRLAVLAGVFAFFCYYFFVVSPQMSSNLAQFWSAARAGETELAAQFKAAFDADHPTASNALGAIAVTLLVALVTAAWPSGGQAGGDAQTAAAAARPKTPLEEPALLRSRP